MCGGEWTVDPSGCHLEASHAMVSNACVGKRKCIVDTDGEVANELRAKCGSSGHVVAAVEAVCGCADTQKSFKEGHLDV